MSVTIGLINAFKVPSTLECGLCQCKEGYIEHDSRCGLRMVIELLQRLYKVAMPELKTSEEWHNQLYPDVVIMDPDGWDRMNYEYSFHKEKISKQEFENRFMSSTIMGAKRRTSVENHDKET